MKVLKIKGNPYTDYLDIDVYLTKGYESFFNSLEQVKEVAGLLPNIDIPVSFQGETLLMLACEYSLSPYVINFLLEKGANPLARDLNGKNTEDHLFFSKDKELMYQLMKPSLEQYAANFTEVDRKAKYKQGWDLFKYICK